MMEGDDAASQRRHRIVLDSAHRLGDFVVLKCDPEGDVGVVTGLNLRPTALAYEVSWPNKSFQSHFEIELSPATAPANPREKA